MRNEHTPTARESARVSRRSFMSIAAAGAASLPVAAIAKPMAKTSRLQDAGELPVERFERLAAEMSETLNDYLDGKFYACIYPSAAHDLPVNLTNIAAAQRKPSLDQQLDACVEQLKCILARMHPETDIRGGRVMLDDDGAWQFSLSGVIEYQDFDGDGLYEVSSFGAVTTFWLEQRFYCRVSDGAPLPGMPYYLATEWQDGKPCDAERKLHSPRIFRKLSGEVVL